MKKRKLNELAVRMKRYEETSDIYLNIRVPVIIRVDGKSFHSFTKYTRCKKPFDDDLINAMIYATKNVLCQMDGGILAYIQSDECSFLLSDLNRPETQAWFDYRLQKICSITSSMFTAYFNEEFKRLKGIKINAFFDARAFNIPLFDIPNYFLWRIKDWKRNSVMMFARTYFSHKELLNKDINTVLSMLKKINKNWEKLDSKYKKGIFIIKDKSERAIIETSDIKNTYEDLSNLINKYIKVFYRDDKKQ